MTSPHTLVSRPVIALGKCDFQIELGPHPEATCMYILHVLCVLHHTLHYAQTSTYNCM